MKKKMNFEESLSRLEEIIRKMEEEQQPLEDLLKLYGEGVALLGVCRQQLDKAEKKLEQSLEE
jgi:exodeoxyribonuclease VII small subunit